MLGGHGDTIRVDLVEVDDDATTYDPTDATDGGDGGDGPAATGTGDRGARRGSRPRRRGVLVSAAVVLALAVTGGALVALDARREQERQDALADRGWSVVDLDEPLAEAWRLPVGGWLTTTGAGVVVLRSVAPDGGDAALLGIDVDAGEVIWEEPDPRGWCDSWNPVWSEYTREDLIDLRLGRGSIEEIPAATRLVCVEDTGFAGSRPDVGVGSAVRVLDLATGAEVGRFDVPGALANVVPVGTDVLAASVGAGGTVSVTRARMATGQVVWSVETDVVLDDGAMYAGLWPQVRDGVVELVEANGFVVFAADVETGRLVEVDQAVVPDDGAGAQLVLPDGALVKVSSDLGTGSEHSSVVVVAPDGTERFTTLGDLWTPFVNDGSMADRIVVRGAGGRSPGELVALDVETGEELWTAPARGAGAMLQIDGVVVAGGSSYVWATDLRDGNRIWEHEGGLTSMITPITDGTRVVLTAFDGGGAHLVTRDVRTGVERWRVPTLADFSSIEAVGDGIVVAGDSETVFYR